MAKTLSNILKAVGSVLDLDAAEPSGDELTLRTNFANQAVEEAAATIQLSEFKEEYVLNISAGVTVSLPTNFRELQDDPRLLIGTNWESWPEIEAEERYQYVSGDEFCYVMGNPSEGYNLIFNSPTANCTLSIVYQRFPSGMATLTDTCELSDTTFVEKKIESYVLYARGDDRFQIAESRAALALQNMAGREMKGSGGQSRDTSMKFQSPLS